MGKLGVTTTHCYTDPRFSCSQGALVAEAFVAAVGF